MNSTINNYYEWIYNSLDSNSLIKQIVLILIYTTKKITIADLSKILNLSILEISDSIDSLYPLIIKSGDGECYAYHNDVKLFFKNKFICTKWYTTYVKELIKKIKIIPELLHNVMVDMIIPSDLDLFDYYNLDYLKESFYKAIPFDFLLLEFRKVVGYFIKNRRYERTNIMNIYLSTIKQMDNVIRFNNNGGNYYIENNNKYLLSEIYDYDFMYEYETIINDIFYCLNNNYIDRANYLFEKYFKIFDIYKLFDILVEEKKYDHRILNKIGYICRFYEYNFEQNIFDKLGFPFIEGWIKCSIFYPDNYILNFSCMTKGYYEKLLNVYITEVMKNDMENNYYNEVKWVVVSFNMDIYSYIKLYEKYRQSKELDYLKTNLYMIVPQKKSSNGEYTYFFKMINYLRFCYNDFVVIDELHEKLRSVLGIGLGSRAYPITEKIYGSFKLLYQYLYLNKKYSAKRVIELFDDVFFADKQHGSGSAHDCDYFASSKVIFSMIYYLCEKDELLKEEIANHYLEINKCCNRYIIWEIFPVFYSYKEKGYQFLKQWYLQNGYLWTYDNSTIEYEGKSIIEALYSLDFKDEASRLNSILTYRKNIGFVANKDYSLGDLYLWLERFIEKGNANIIERFGAIVLSINDYASNNGDNRYSSEIEKSILKISILAGAKYFDALYNMKNNPKNFYHWRLNASEVISELSGDEYDDLYTLLIKWNLHKKSKKNISLTKWLDLINNNWNEFVDQVICFEKEDNINSKNDLLIILHDYIPISRKKDFYNRVIKSILINRNKYGYEYDWSNRVIDEYYDYIPSEDYHIMLDTIIKETLVNDNFYNLQRDFNLLTKCLFSNYCKEDYIVEFDNVISMFEIWIGHPYFVNINNYEYVIDKNVIDFDSFVNKQLCIKK